MCTMEKPEADCFLIKYKACMKYHFSKQEIVSTPSLTFTSTIVSSPFYVIYVAYFYTPFFIRTQFFQKQLGFRSHPLIGSFVKLQRELNRLTRLAVVRPLSLYQNILITNILITMDISSQVAGLFQPMSTGMSCFNLIKHGNSNGSG